mmetsp:Transcript_11123/g.28504  ORF Transcript_11123/g.28504 Transcript_11123/m.28504 type:complete len:246 (-) Transcript_11123:69-806(-)
MVRLFAQCFARLAAVLAAPLRLQRPPGRRPRWAAVGSRAPGRQVHQAAAAPPTSPPPAPLSPPPPGLWRRFCSPVPEVPPAAPHAQSCRLPPQSLQAPSAPQLPPTPPLRLAPGWTEVRAGQEHRPQPVAAAGHPPPRARREGTWSWWARRGRGESPSAPWPPAAPPPLPQPGPGRRCRCRCRCRPHVLQHDLGRVGRLGKPSDQWGQHRVGSAPESQPPAEAPGRLGQRFWCPRRHPCQCLACR